GGHVERAQRGLGQGVRARGQDGGRGGRAHHSVGITERHPHVVGAPGQECEQAAHQVGGVRAQQRLGGPEGAAAGGAPLEGGRGVAVVVAGDGEHHPTGVEVPAGRRGHDGDRARGPGPRRQERHGQHESRPMPLHAPHGTLQRRMSLTGNLETMGLPEVLQWIATSRKTGTLYLRRAATEKRIVFQHGTVYSSWSNHPRESLGQFLIRDRFVTEEQLFRALQRQEKNGKMLGGILMEEGILSAEDLRQALTTKAEETVYDLFLWPDGSFEFRDAALPNLLHVDLPVTHVIREGIRRVDEWRRIRAVFPSPDSTFKVRGGGTRRKPAAG